MLSKENRLPIAHAFSPLALEMVLLKIGAFEGDRVTPLPSMIVVGKDLVVMAMRAVSAYTNVSVMVDESAAPTEWWACLVQAIPATVLYSEGY